MQIGRKNENIGADFDVRQLERSNASLIPSEGRQSDKSNASSNFKEALARILKMSNPKSAVSATDVVLRTKEIQDSGDRETAGKGR